MKAGSHSHFTASARWKRARERERERKERERRGGVCMGDGWEGEGEEERGSVCKLDGEGIGRVCMHPSSSFEYPVILLPLALK